MDNTEKARKLINKHLYLHGGDGLGITDGDVYRAVLDAVSEALTIPFVSNSFVVEEAKAQIYKCKEVAYGKNTDASNVLEGDYGSWQDWTDVLVNFANKIKQNYY